MRKFAPQHVVMIQAAVADHHQLMDTDLISRLLVQIAAAGNLEPAADQPMITALPCLDLSGEMAYTFLLPLKTSHLKMTFRLVPHTPHVGVDTWPEDDVILLFFHSCQPVAEEAIHQSVIEHFQPLDSVAEKHIFFQGA